LSHSLLPSARTLVAWLRRPWFGPLAALCVVYALFALSAPETFAGSANLGIMARQTAVVGMAAIGMTLIMVQGGIDLSVGSSVALTTVIVASALQAGAGPGAAVLVGVAVATCAGCINGALVLLLQITPFIVTLGTMSILRGVAKGLANEQKIDAETRGLEALMSALPDAQSHWIFPVGVWLTLLAAAIAAAFLIYTRVGRHVVATGSNPLTARLCGVRVGRITLLVYALGGLLAGLAGVLELSTLTVGDPTDSLGLELEVIAAVVIGGGSLSGGQGSVVGTLFGALLLTVIKTGCTHVGLPNWVQEILTGGIIVVAMGIDRMRQRAQAT
jgi:ribose transport system permease protein